ncbi:MAG TPA: metallophosphoesterase family protein, partial [Actinomycetota bacterium]|nr:metallophosphoesterase family protein [Actinomycetota bacterium]
MTIRIRAFVTACALVAVAAAQMAPAADAGPPRGVHLSFTRDSRTTATVTWLTDGTTIPNPVVEYGSTESLGAVEDATTQPAPRVKAFVHTATLGGLDPGQTVYYRVGGTSGYSQVRSFHTAPTDGAWSFVAIADMGTSSQAVKTTQAIVAENPDLVVHAGDLSYANGNDPVWDTWLDVIEPYASRIPYMTAPGNHEYETFPKSWSSYLSRMSMPGNELWYGFDYANVHFTVLQSHDTAHNTQGTLDDMITFAEQDLARAVERRAAGEIDHIIVMQHHPLYGNQDGSVERQRNPTWITLEEQWFHRYDIDLVIVGHNHHYERSKPMVYGVPTT